MGRRAKQCQLPVGTDCIIPFAQPGFQLPLAVLDGPVITGRIIRAVDGDHHMFFQQVVDRRMIQVTSVVPLDEKRRAKPAEVPGQMTGDLLPAGLICTGQGSELITGT